MTDQDRLALADCRFCNSKAVALFECEDESAGCSTFWIECEDCGARGSISEYKGGAVQCWNTRAVAQSGGEPVAAGWGVFWTEGGMACSTLKSSESEALWFVSLLQIVGASVEPVYRAAPIAGEPGAMREALERTASALRELHAMVWGECPSLLNEDSGGSARHDTEVTEALGLADAALASSPQPAADSVQE